MIQRARRRRQRHRPRSADAADARAGLPSNAAAPTRPRWSNCRPSSDKAIAGIDQSLAIITALLRLAEIENSRRSAGFAAMSPLHEMLREVCDIYEPIAENKNVALRG